MENASKALLLAAAILIAIILISLGVYIVNQGSGIVKDSGQVLDEVAIQQFNEKFDIYEGTITGSKVKQLIKAVNANNTSKPEQKIAVTVDSTNYDGTATIPTTGLGTQAKYDVVCNVGTSGLIETITITKK